MSRERERTTGCILQDFARWAGSPALTLVQLLCFIGLALLHDATYQRLAMHTTFPETVPAANMSVYSATELEFMLSLSQAIVFLANTVAVIWPFTAHFLLLIHVILSLILLSVYANFNLCERGLAQLPCNWLLMVSTTTLVLSDIGVCASFFSILRTQGDFRWCRRYFQMPKPQRNSVTATGTCYTYPMHRYCRHAFRRMRHPQTAEASTSTTTADQPDVSS
ncbi:unnamed protein product [Dibothriocephalus latus]|uniref:Uncharacterized protein n=1 Tax=Dibothriocephalus latus TaxID=60516 RepID=A0A3P7LKW5_DIBLA|nr:unnamed protein product [Dibothriocephalus latus]